MGSTHATHAAYRARIAPTLAALTIVVAAAACSNDADEDASGAAAADAPATEAPATVAATRAATAAVEGAERDDAAGSPTGDGLTAGDAFGLDAIGRDLAIVLDVSMTSDDVRCGSWADAATGACRIR